MTDRGNPNPEETNKNNYYTHICPFCEEEIKHFPSHLPCEGYNADD